MQKIKLCKKVLAEDFLLSRYLLQLEIVTRC